MVAPEMLPHARKARCQPKAQSRGAHANSVERHIMQVTAVFAPAIVAAADRRSSSSGAHTIRGVRHKAQPPPCIVAVRCCQLSEQTPPAHVRSWFKPLAASFHRPSRAFVAAVTTLTIAAVAAAADAAAAAAAAANAAADAVGDAEVGGRHCGPQPFRHHPRRR